MQSLLVVFVNVLVDNAVGVLLRQRAAGPNAFALDRFVPALQLSVGLRVVRRRGYVSHAVKADQLPEVAGEELFAIVADHPRMCLRVPFMGPLNNDLHIVFFHGFANVPGQYVAAVAVQNGDQVVECTANVHVADVRVPMTVRP